MKVIGSVAVIFLTLAAFTLSSCSTAPKIVSNSNYIEVKSQGSGATQEQSYTSAIQDAIRQTVGQLISSETIIKNDQVIKDEVVLTSYGFVEKIISQKFTVGADGVYYANVECLVRKGKIKSLFLKKQIPLLDFDGVTLAANAISQAVSEDQVAVALSASLNDLLEKFPQTVEIKCSHYKVISNSQKEAVVEVYWRLDLNETEFNRLLEKVENAVRVASTRDKKHAVRLNKRTYYISKTSFDVLNKFNHGNHPDFLIYFQAENKNKAIVLKDKVKTKWSLSFQRSLYFQLSLDGCAEYGDFYWNNPTGYGNETGEVGFKIFQEFSTFFSNVSSYDGIQICKPRKTSDGVATLKVPTTVLPEIKNISGYVDSRKNEKDRLNEKISRGEMQQYLER